MPKSPYVQTVWSPNPWGTVVRNTRGELPKYSTIGESGPQYNDDTFPGVDGSLQPVSVDMNNLVGYNHTVTLEGIATIPVGKWFLYGRQGDLRLFKSSEIEITEEAQKENYLHVYEVLFKAPWARKDFPWGFAGDVTWDLHQLPSAGSPTTVINLGVVRLEIYGITSALPSFFKGSIDVNFLRTFLLPARSSSAIDWPRHVAKAAFWDFGFRYKSYGGGAPSYASGYTSETFHLRRWTRDAGKNAQVNCYDQAGLVQIALALAGPRVGKSQIMYLSPFGYINPTELVGRGRTNNPFPAVSDCWLLPRNSPDRSRFRNHTFVRLGGDDGKIIDACAGPHLGTESLEEYIQGAISTVATSPDDTNPNSTTLYTEIFKPATPSDLSEYHRGVTAIDACPIQDPERVAQKVKDGKTPYSKRSMEVAIPAGGIPETPLVDFKLSELNAALEKASGCTLTSDLRVNGFGAALTWDIPFFLPNGTEKDDIDVQVVVLRTSREAINYFEWDLHNYHNTDPDHWTKLGDSAFDNCLSLASECVKGKHGVIAWVQGNVFFRIEGYPDSKTLWNTYGRPLFDLASKTQSETAPFEVSLEREKTTITSGDALKVKVGIARNERVYWTVSDVTGQGEDENPEIYTDLLLPTEWSFTEKPEGIVVTFVRIQHPRKHTLRWFFANEDASLQVYTKDVEVELVRASS
ncbi:hypothetical protein BKA70DRAFT_241378 [Coprinopsis sp. MPI-PUGE-AT-0042]|nr:hypothetical protein BKA70DRAFT_241378 [Coprinopsis sp. MPI-PUGE-AT-0042]